MSKLSNEELKAYAGVGYVPIKNQVPAMSIENEELNKYLQSLKYESKQDTLSKLMPGYFSEDEQTQGYDEYEDTILDEDGKYRSYRIRKDKSGKILGKALTSDIEGINIQDVTGGKAPNPLNEQVQRQRTYKNMFSDIDPNTDEYKSYIGKSALENSWDNTIWGSIDRLFGGDVGKQLFDKSIQSFEMRGNDAYYAGQKLNLSDEVKESYNEWLTKKNTFEASGFSELFASTALSFALDTPFFIAGGQGASALMRGIAPGMALASSLPGRVANHITQNLAMMSMIETPRIIEHTQESGIDGLLTDLQHIGSFAVIAGGFSTLGDYVGSGVSKLLQKPKFLQLNQAAQFLRKNPQITKTLAGGLTSGALGYTTGGETTEEKLATALTFAGMHFATPSAWKSFAKGAQKNVMIDANQEIKLKRAIEAGLSFDEALKVVDIPQYYEREGNKIYPINNDVLATKGEIQRLPEDINPPSELTAETARNYKYITEAPSFAKITLKHALKAGKIQILVKGIKEGMPANPYNAETQKEQYQEFEYGKNIIANKIASATYAQKLNSIFKAKQLPEDATLNKMIVDMGNNFKLPISDVKTYIYDNLPKYFQDPESFQTFLDETYEPNVSKNLAKVIDTAAMAFAKNVEAKAVKSIMQNILKPSETKLLPQAEISEPTNYVDKAGRSVKRQIEAEQLAKGTIPPSSKVVYYDFKGQMLPLEVKGGKAKILGTEIEMDWEVVKDKTKTKQQIKEEVAAKKESAKPKPTEVKPNDTVKFSLEGKDVSAKVTTVAKDDLVVQLEDGKKISIKKSMVKDAKLTEPTKEGVKDAKQEEMQGEQAVKSTETSTEAQGKEIESKPIESIAPEKVEPPTVPLQSVSEEKLAQLSRNPKTLNATLDLTSVLKPGEPLSFRDAEGKVKPEVLGRIAELESSARESVNEINKVTGKKIKPEELIAISLRQHYTAEEAGSIMALKGIYSDNASKNRDFIKNTLKKYDLSIKKTGEGADVPSRELESAGMSVVNKPKTEPTGLGMYEDLVKKGKITQAEFDRLKKELGEEFNRSDKDEVITDPVQIEKEIEMLQTLLDRAGLSIPIQRVESITTPEGEQAAGSFVHPTKNLLDSFFKMNVRESMLNTGGHEFAELGMKFMGEQERWSKILDEYKGDKEAVADAFGEYARTHQVVDTSTVFGKLKHFFNTIADFFADKLGWGVKSSYFRRLADGTLSLREAAKENMFATEDTAMYDHYGKDMEYKKIPTSTSIEDHAEQLRDISLSIQEYERNLHYTGKPERLAEKIKSNPFLRTVTGVGDALYKAAFQNRNIADERNRDGSIKSLYTHGIYHKLEDVILKTHHQINTNIEDKAVWDSAKPFLALGVNKDSFVSKFGKYENDVFEGTRKEITQDVAKGETFDEFIDRGAKELGFNEAEKDVFKRFQTLSRNMQDLNRQGFKETLMQDAKENLADGLSRTKLESYFGDRLDYTKKEAELYKDANSILSSDTGLFDKIATDISESVVPKYNNLYYNSSRPSNPNYYSFTSKKPVDVNGKVTTDPAKFDHFEYVNGYGKDKKEAMEQVNKFGAEGYAVETFDRIGDIISKEQFDRLTANQLMNLVSLGHIEASNPVIQSLLRATKTGNYEQHSVKKRYIKGMHYTPEEFEHQAVRLINEAVSSSTRKHGLGIIRGEIASNRAQVNDLLKSTVMSQADKDKIKRDFDYSTQIYNQVAHSDQSFIDAWRQGATAYYVGMKPSFWFQQMMQPLQTTLPEAISQVRGTSLNGSKVWTDSFKKAFDLAIHLNAERKGETTNLVEQEFLDAYRKLDSQGLMGAVGMEELTGKGKDIDMRYGDAKHKIWRSFIKIANLGGAAAEKFTRLHSLATFYEIGKAKGLTGAGLEEYLINNVKNVMGGWGALDRPAVFQSKQLGKSEQKVLKAIDKAFFTFKTYANTNLGQYDRLFRNKQYGALGTKALIGVGMHGITKFPLAATVFALANLFTEDDSEYEVLKALDELDGKIGGNFGSILAKGLPSQSGINMQNLFDERSGFATDVFSETRSRGVNDKLIEAMFGAPYGLSKDLVDSASGVHKLLANNIKNDYTMTDDEKSRALKNLTKATPLFFRNIFNAMNLKKDGVELQNKTLVKSDDISWGDVVFKAIGFNPSTVADAYEYQLNGTPAKLARAKGKQTELKKIRKETTEPAELRKISELLRSAQKEEAILTKQLASEKRSQILTK